MSNHEIIIGIDLGTTYCSVAHLTDDGRHAVPVENGQGEFSTPSVVTIGDDGVEVGREAERLAAIHPERSVSNPKRYLGDFDKAWEIDGTFYTPIDITAFILRQLKSDAEAKLGRVNKAVITVPAHFDAFRREQTIAAARQAGLEVLDLVNEPVAAALSYVMDPNLGLNYAPLFDDQAFAVFDLGGGTFDLSLVSYSGDQVRVLATTGDLHLGGLDWNQKMIDALADRFVKKYGIDPSDDPRPFSELARAVEEAKRQLSDERRQQTLVKVKCQHKTMKVYLTREWLEKLTRSLVDRARRLTEKLLHEHGNGQVSLMVVVGGASRMPMIKQMIGELPGITLNKSLHADLAIAQGAAYYAGLLTSRGGLPRNHKDRAARESGGFRVFNVCAHELGVIVRDESGQRVSHTLIPANSPLPVSASLAVCTVKRGQRRVHLRIVEGRGKKGNSAVCHCVIDNLPKGLPSGSLVDVNFTCDATGVLKIVAHHRDSGLLATVHRSLSGWNEAEPPGR